jgi:hypothetical protein
MKKKTFKVSSDFIRAGYSYACREWKEKLSAKFPELFSEDRSTVKFGTIIKMYGEDYVLADVGVGACLVNTKTGNRWEDPIAVHGSHSIKLKDLERIINDSVTYENENITIGGQTLKKEVPAPETINVDWDFLQQAYTAANSEWQGKIKATFPEAFGEQYVKIVKDGEDSTTLSTSLTDLPENTVNAIVGYGLAPRPELQYSCIMFESNISNMQVELETGESYGKAWVAVKLVPKK